ncbi:MAG: 16S rRNA (cytidine(1402)-2'-O)-methyltransferase [Acidobacteria bacterium]|nr:16S rRNA (cytidine(1402)-2'-O)-methyltransferase [Acidobacteriota bacterium]
MVGKSGTLYLVATPIGNLEDISLRGLRVLRQVNRIACEDTRQTAKLLRHYEISTPTLAFHQFNEHRVLQGLIRRLLAGEDLALVTDGGTPVISDPGFSLVRAASESAIPVVPVPGASAPLTALIVSGLPSDRFLFLGFLPHRSSDRQRLFEEMRDRKETLVCFDSPHRVRRSLEEMAAILGDRRAALCREMTKLHEEFRRGRLRDLASGLEGQAVRGEITLVVEGAEEIRPGSGVDLDIRKAVEEEIHRGLSHRDAVRSVAQRFSLLRREVYRISRPDLGKTTAQASNEEE